MPRLTAPRQKLTPPQVAHRLGVSPDKVLAWIRNGELKAINAATKPHGRPRWLIGLADLEAFEKRRSTTKPVPVQAQRKKRRETGVIEFF